VPDSLPGIASKNPFGRAAGVTSLLYDTVVQFQGQWAAILPLAIAKSVYNSFLTLELASKTFFLAAGLVSANPLWFCPAGG
jgi:hypothetical protein